MLWILDFSIKCNGHTTVWLNSDSTNSVTASVYGDSDEVSTEAVTELDESEFSQTGTYCWLIFKCQIFACEYWYLFLIKSLLLNLFWKKGEWQIKDFI